MRGPRGTPGPPAFAPRAHDVHRTAPWTQFAYVSRRLHELVADLLAAAELPPGAVVVDYGCADAPYRHHFDERVRYVGADLPGNPDATVELGPGGTLPLADGSAHLVLSTQVLEHVEDPAAYLAECRRVLAPGGSLVLTTHGIMYLHRDPTDYWRWTADGLTKLVQDAGFEVAEHRGVLGLAAAALQLLQDATRGRVWRPLLKPYTLLFQAAIALADRCTTEARRRDDALVLGVRATRPLKGATPSPAPAAPPPDPPGRSG